MQLSAILVVFLPLLSALVNGLWGARICKSVASCVSSCLMIATSCAAALVFYHSYSTGEVLHITLFSWIDIGIIKANWVIYVDRLTALMFIVVTFVSTVVHIYSLGYMEDDEALPKFLSFLSLFTFFMLSLVSADNFLQLFFGWEGVGLCSYLLIGYWYHKPEANAAAIKAFVTNRVGDFAFILGMVMIIWHFGAIDFASVFAKVPEFEKTRVTFLGINAQLLDAICILLFIGCMGKSAQIGLHVWLPDAMEGPTPVSALIHAATMVTAGVFLVARCSFIFEYSHLALQIVTLVGGITCLFAATVALAQTDIKKIIAYSTCSQLGYMFISCGASAYNAGIFHLFTHAFFKALLFLAAGGVIHACHEQDIFKMGGLRKKLPLTHLHFWIGSLAIIGIFPLAGYYSKDLILESAYAAGGSARDAFWLGLVAAAFTALYSMKIIILTFYGKTNLQSDVFEHAHEAPKIMNIPLTILVIGAVFAGMFGVYMLSIEKEVGYFGDSLFYLARHEVHVPRHVEMLPLIVGISAMLIGIYAYRTKLAGNFAGKFAIIHKILQNKYYFDELYAALFVNQTARASRLSGIFDKQVIDDLGPNAFARITQFFGWCICAFQTGYIFNYALIIILAITSCVTFFVINFMRVLGT